MEHMIMKKTSLALAALGLLLTACADGITAPQIDGPHVAAAVVLDLETGVGFVGKGDVQSVFGWNNPALQANHAGVQFRIAMSMETTWTCSRPHPVKPEDIVQERSSTTTLQGLLSSTARERNQITGFLLEGFDGTPTSSTDGPAVGTCPSTHSDFTFDEESVEENGGGGGVQVKHPGFLGGAWQDL
jgi:hypothetical protein